MPSDTAFSRALLPALAAALWLFGCRAAPSPPAQHAPSRPEPVLHDLEGRPHRPLDPAGAKAVVVIFVTTDCPISNGYAPEIRRIVADHARDPVRFYLVHVDPDVEPEDARNHAREYRLPGTILRDPEHLLVRALGATTTPEAAVLDAQGRLVYRGRIDNWYGDLGRKRPRPTRRELRDAIAAVLAGRTVEVSRTRAIGCELPDISPPR